MTHTDRVALARLWAVVLTIFSFLPFANWIAGGHAAPWYDTSLSEWISGSAISIGSAVVLFVVLRRLNWWPTGWSSVAETAERHSAATGALLGMIAVILFGAVAQHVLSGRPLLIDEIVQVMQARILAGGHVSRPADAHPEFFSCTARRRRRRNRLFAVSAGRTAHVGAGCHCGGGLADGTRFWRYCRRRLLATRAQDRGDSRHGVRRRSPVRRGAIHGVHGCVAHEPRPCPRVALSGAARTSLADKRHAARFRGAVHRIMPGSDDFDPASGRCCVCAARRLVVADSHPATRRRPFPAFLLRVLVSSSRFSESSPTTTRQPVPRRSSAMSCSGARVTALDSTKRRGEWRTHRRVESSSSTSTFCALQTYLFETPLPSLVPAIASLALVRRLSAFDRYLLASSALLVLGYFAYWHDGFFLGPRFFYLLLPALVIWTARLPSIVRDRFPGRLALIGSCCSRTR